MEHNFSSKCNSNTNSPIESPTQPPPLDGVTYPIIQHIFVKGQDLKENKNILNDYSSEFFFKFCPLNLLGYSVGGTN